MTDTGEPPVHFPLYAREGYALCGYNFALWPPSDPEHILVLSGEKWAVTCENCKLEL